MTTTSAAAAADRIAWRICSADSTWTRSILPEDSIALVVTSVVLAPRRAAASATA
jgi:hypothetical protein